MAHDLLSVFDMRLTVASKTAEKTAPSSPPLPRPSTALPSLSDHTLSAIAAPPCRQNNALDVGSERDRDRRVVEPTT